MITWKRDTHQYANGTRGRIGEVVIFYIGWDGLSPPDKNKRHKLSSLLPELTQSSLGHFATEDDAKDAAEEALTTWLVRARLRSTS